MNQSRCPLGLTAYDKLIICCEETRRFHLHESPIAMGYYGLVLIQHHWAEVFKRKSTASAEEFFASMVMCS